MSIVAKQLDGSRWHLVRMEGLGPGHIELDEDPAPLQRGTAPNFRLMSILAKQSPISATAEHL